MLKYGKFSQASAQWEGFCSSLWLTLCKELVLTNWSGPRCRCCTSGLRACWPPPRSFCAFGPGCRELRNEEEKNWSKWQLKNKSSWHTVPLISPFPSHSTKCFQFCFLYPCRCSLPCAQGGWLYPHGSHISGWGEKPVSLLNCWLHVLAPQQRRDDVSKCFTQLGCPIPF